MVSTGFCKGHNGYAPSTILREPCQPAVVRSRTGYRREHIKHEGKL